MMHLALLLCLPAQLVESTDFPEAAQRALLAATVRIVAKGKEVSGGTGVVVRQEGKFRYVLTAAHVVEKAAQFEIHYFTAKSHPDPVETTKEGELLATFPDQDVALLRVPIGKLTVQPLPLAPSGTAAKEVRFVVLSAGCDGSAAPSCQADEVRAKKLLRLGKEKTTFVWECSKVPVGGRSGGPLVDAKGRLIGLCSGSQDERGYYTHLDEIHAALKREGLHWVVEEKDGERER